MDVISYALSKKIAAHAVSGVQSMSVNGQTLTINTKDSGVLTMTFPTPKDGVSVTDIDVNANNQIVFTMSDGSEFISGKIPTVKGEPGFSPTITENADNTDKIYKLDITTADSTFTTPNLKGADGSGEDNKIDSISVNGVNVVPDGNKNVDITVPTVTNDLTDELKSSYDDAVTAKHIHNNKTVLDNITAEDISQIAQNKTDIEILNGTGEGSVDKKIADIVSSFTYLTKEVVTEEEINAMIANPTTANFNKIYLVKDNSSIGVDKYLEYQRLGNEESSEVTCTGDTSTDLSNYIMKEEGKGLSSNDYDNDAVSKVAKIDEIESNANDAVKKSGDTMTGDLSTIGELSSVVNPVTYTKIKGGDGVVSRGNASSEIKLSPGFSGIYGSYWESSCDIRTEKGNSIDINADKVNKINEITVQNFLDSYVTTSVNGHQPLPEQIEEIYYADGDPEVALGIKASASTLDKNYLNLKEKVIYRGFSIKTPYNTAYTYITINCVKASEMSNDITKLNSNLTNKTKLIFELGDISLVNGSHLDSTTWKRSGLIKVTPNTKYTLNRTQTEHMNIVGYKEDKTVITDGLEPSSAIINGCTIAKCEFTTTPTTNYIGISIMDTNLSENITLTNNGIGNTVVELVEDVDELNDNLMEQKMLGWTVPSECPVQNYVDSDGVFHQRVGRVDLGSLDWEYSSSTCLHAYIEGILDKKAFCTKYIYVIGVPSQGEFTTIWWHYNSYIQVVDSNYTDATTFKNAMQGVYLYYELSTEKTISVDGNEVVSKVNESLGVIGKCKNLLNPTLQTTTLNGVTCTNNGDGTYTLNGTNNTDSSIWFVLTDSFTLEPNKKYKLVGGYPNSSRPFVDSTASWFLELYNLKTSLQYTRDYGDGRVFTITDTTLACEIGVRKGATLDNFTFKPMLTECLDATYDDFVPYTGDGETLTHDVAELKNDLGNYALKSKYGDTTINVGRKASTTVGAYSTAEGLDTTASGGSSHAEGSNTTASGDSSHAEGDSTTASGMVSHAEGGNTTASRNFSHAEGSSTTASGDSSHAEGVSTTASGDSSHAEGYRTTASGMFSHAEGYYTKAANYASHVFGKYNAAMTTGGAPGNTTGTAFVIGNGTSNSALSNAFSVQFDGTVKAKSTITASTTADYAEFFEWLDKNPNEEDRVGHFVTLDGDKIKIATSEDDYILGIVSGEPFVLGNGDCDTWNGMYLHDEFRRTMYEPAPKIIEILDNEGNPTGEYEEVESEYEGTRPILNPDYDPTQKYISRFDRVEWSPIGMLGVLAVLHDGTAEVNGYVTVNNEGIATKCTRDTRNSYRVIKKVSDKVVEVIFR